MCFECTSPQILDTETLACVDTCVSPKVLIQSDQYSMSSLCRSPNFYVDPNSANQLEIGSRDYPYKNLKPVFSEILNYHSHRNINITVHLKENTEIYMEESQGYVLNITSLKITSYSLNSTSPGRATIVPTNIVQSGVNPKSAFHIMKNTDLKLPDAIAKGNFSSYEIGKISQTGIVLIAARTEICISNVNVISMDTYAGYANKFLYLVYLQTKGVTIGKF